MGSSHHHHHHSSGLVPRGSHMASMSDSEVNQEAKPEVKPEVKPETHINLKVSDGSSEIFFKIKKTTPLRRLMEAFAKRQGKEMDSLRFLYDGIRIEADQTPEDLDMEDNDIIEAHREQIGGSLEVLFQGPMIEMSGFWPEGYRCALFLSFDYDASSAEMLKAPHDLVAQSRGRYAPKVAIPRLLDLLDGLGIKATFFVPGWTADHYPDSVEEILSRGHEVAGHGYLHERMNELSAEGEEGVFNRLMEALERVGVKPVGYRAPYWIVTERTLGHLRRLGFRYSSNFMDDDMPYILEGEHSIVELPVEWMLDDWPQFELQRKAPEEVYRLWKPELEGVYELGRYAALTCHPQCIGRISRLKMLERLLRELLERGDVWFPLGRELADWARRRLASS